MDAYSLYPRMVPAATSPEATAAVVVEVATADELRSDEQGGSGE